jgi:trehalose 6-phosphate phosphatase
VEGVGKKPYLGCAAREIFIHAAFVMVMPMSTTNPAISAAPPIALPPPPLPAADAHWALFLDVDGTLLDFVDDPLAVHAGTSLRELLHALYRALDGAMALVSGRGLADLDRIFGASHWAAAGLHGLQLRRADGSIREIAPSPARQAQLCVAAQALAARFEGVTWEDKHNGIALHCRRAPAQFMPLHAAAIDLLPQLPGYELQPGNLVLEFKPKGMDKGKALLELLDSEPFRGRLPVYLGDDLTDEHAFASINPCHGLSVRVGDREPTHARFTLPGPAATQAWLDRVLDALKQGTPAHAPIPGGHTARQP